jgi:ribosomal protein S18 acetylase RimI-like enzyme
VDEDVRRSVAFARWVCDRTSTSIVPFRWGHAYLDDEFPRRYDSNFVWVQRPDRELTVESAIREADRILGERGLRHRSVMVDEGEAAERLAPGFAERGWGIERIVLMILRGSPDPRTPAVRPVVEERSFETARPILEETTRREPWATEEETVRALTDYRRKLAERVGARFFCGLLDGAPVGCCELYLRGDEAQVEAVITLEEARGRGVGTAMVLGAVEAAREAGATWIHLFADASDWPREWYRRLGFVDAGGFTNFVLAPEQGSGASKAEG